MQGPKFDFSAVIARAKPQLNALFDDDDSDMSGTAASVEQAIASTALRNNNERGAGDSESDSTEVSVSDAGFSSVAELRKRMLLEQQDQDSNTAVVASDVDPLETSDVDSDSDSATATDATVSEERRLAEDMLAEASEEYSSAQRALQMNTGPGDGSRNSKSKYLDAKAALLPAGGLDMSDVKFVLHTLEPLCDALNAK